MATIFNEKHQALLSVIEFPVGETENVQDGTVIEHRQEVQQVEFYMYDAYKEAYTKVTLSKIFIDDITRQIATIEAERKEAPYFKLPF